MRILVAHNVPRARTGGMSRIMGFIHDEIARDGHTVDYLTAEDLPAKYRGAAARVSFPLLVVRHVRAAARAGRAYDVVNVHEPSAAAAAVLRRAGRLPPLVVTSHGLEQRAWKLAREEARLGRAPLSRRARLFHPATVLSQARASLAFADMVFVLNTEDRDVLLRQGRSASSILRIFPGASPEYAGAAAGRDYSRFRRLLFAGTWRTNKGIVDLVDAMRLIWKARPGVRLTLFGAGVPDAVIHDAFGPDMAHVDRLSAASDAEAAGIYADHDLLLLPSLFEGTPLVLMEAMASGLPIVTTNVCGMRDVIEDGRNGLLVPLRDPRRIAEAVLAFAGDPGLRQRLGEAAAAEAREVYTWPQVAKPVLKAYKSLV